MGMMGIRMGVVSLMMVGVSFEGGIKNYAKNFFENFFFRSHGAT